MPNDAVIEMRVRDENGVPWIMHVREISRQLDVSTLQREMHVANMNNGERLRLREQITGR